MSPDLSTDVAEKQPTSAAPAQQGSKIDLTNLNVIEYLPKVAEFWGKIKWLVPVIEMLGHFKLPKEVTKALDEISDSVKEGKEVSTDSITKALETARTNPDGTQILDTPDAEIGEPVMTWNLARQAYYLHYDDNMGTRQIAEMFTKEGNPVSHATVARWILWVEEEIQKSKTLKLKRIGKYGAIIGALAVAFTIGAYLL